MAGGTGARRVLYGIVNIRPSGLAAAVPAVLAFLAGCSSPTAAPEGEGGAPSVGAGQPDPRPPWADGRMIRERAPAGAQAQDLSRFQVAMLDAHNRERLAIQAAPLTWDPDLAAAAASYGPALARLGKLVHSPPQSRPGVGENLWMGSKGAYSLREMTDSWAAEKILFRPGVFPDVSRSGHWSDVGHYSQMIWRGTRRLGCALYSDARWDFLICRYAPGGNVIGQAAP